MIQAPEVLLAELLQAETAVWDALVAGDAAADAAALAESFLGVYPDGVHGKSAHVAQLAEGPSVVSFSLSDARVIPFGAEHGLLIYRADYRRHGQVADEAMYVSSLWQRHTAGSWLNIFSQDTPADPTRVVP